jgi:hypothetical protein
MRFRLSILTAAAILVTAGPALAQAAGAGSDGSSTSRAGGSTSSGSSSSTASVNTSGGANVGVVQGNVAEGSNASGSNNGAAGQGGATGGSTAPAADAADAPNALGDGIVSQVDLPAIDTADDAVPATNSRPDVMTWAAVAVLAVGLAALYRRLPRPSRA